MDWLTLWLEDEGWFLEKDSSFGLGISEMIAGDYNFVIYVRKRWFLSYLLSN